MAREYSVKDSKRLIEAHNSILTGIKSVIAQKDSYAKEIEKTVDVYITKEVINLLKSIPVEELSRGASGIRVKTLREAGYDNIARIAAANEFQLSSINGISQDAAYTIKRIADNFASKARSDVKLIMSVDSKNPQITSLLKNLYKYKTISNVVDEFLKLDSRRKEIEYAIRDAEILTHSFKWVFTSEKTKKQAEKAYKFLQNMIESSYGQNAYEGFNIFNSLNQIQAETVWKDFQNNPISYSVTLEDVCPGILSSGEGDFYGLPEELAQKIQDECFFPDGLKAELRPYQKFGVKYILNREKVLLGDEMGLGKTIQAIATMVSLKNTGATHFMVICPASVIVNWCREISKFSLLSYTKIHGQGRSAALKSWIKTGGVAVTTYETTGYIKFEDNYKFDLLVVDEAHFIKNPSAARSKNVRNIAKKSDRLLFMTGTALENHVDEMISLMEVLQPNIARAASQMAFLGTAPQFREKIAPVYYRRKRENVLKELPECIENIEWCTMTPQEEEVYEKTLYAKNYMAIRRLSWNVEDLKYSSKANRLKELVEDAAEDGRKIIVFSFFLDTIDAVYRLLGRKCVNPINGKLSPQRRQEILDEFEKAPAGTVLPAQIQSGGTGLNIQAASVVIICEPQYKPSIEKQAIARAHRMGQARNVLVYRLMCENSIDERILEILEAKQAEFDAFADKSVAAAEVEINDKSLGNIIEEEIERIKRKKAK